MERFCIVTNKSKDENLEVTGHIKEYLTSHGKECVVADCAIGLSKESNAIGREFMSFIPEDTDCCIVLGGDGTMLQAARSVAFPSASVRILHLIGSYLNQYRFPVV